MSLLVIKGSGETAPAMRAIHREIFARTGAGSAVLLDTPYGFQENADELTGRIRGYFAQSVGREVGLVAWRRSDISATEREAALAGLTTAGWVFAGPGSPTYALRQWRDTPVPGALDDLLERGGTLVLGSAAAVTAGLWAIPVYEIYKVGAELAWVDGLDLLGRATGVRAAVVPHYDNAEGATHDTRFCYLGERRLVGMEQHLPPDVGVLGVDEHTALVLDLDRGSAEVSGAGGVTLRHRGVSRVLPAGSTVALAELGPLLRGEAGDASVAVPPPPELRATPTAATSLAEETGAARASFDAALAARDVDGCIRALLGLDDAITQWSADTLQGADNGRARRELRAMVVRLGELARAGARDPRDAIAPYVETLLELRAGARASRNFATSDLLRDRLAQAGVEVRDSPEGTAWSLA